MKSREQKDAVSRTSAGPEFRADNHGATVTETRTPLSAALGWNAVGFTSQAILQLILGLVLARILGPTTYGLVAMAWVALTPATILADAGLGLALVQKQELTSATIRYSFCVQSLVAFLVSIFLCILAPRLAEFFAAPELIEVLFVGSSILLVQAFGLTSVALLRRQLDFRRLQIVQLVALIGSAVLVSLPLALAGFGIWSPVGGALANAAMTSIGAGVLTPTKTGISRRTISVLVGVAVVSPVLPFYFGMGFWTMSATMAINGALVTTAIYHAARGGSLQEIWRQGSYTSSSVRFLLLNLVNAAAGALPALIIGRFFGAAALGLFDRAFALIVIPVARAAAALETVLFSHHADLHRTGKTQTNVFLRSLSIAFLVGIPFVVGVVENTPLIVDVALGAKWQGVVPLVAPLATLTLSILALQTAVPVLNSRGRSDVDLLAQLASIVLILTSVAFLAVDDTADVLWALVAANGFRVLCVVATAGHLLEVRLQSLLLCIVPGGLTAVLALAVDRIFPENLVQSIPEPARLAIIMGIYALILIFTWFAHRASFFARLFGGSPKGRIADDARGGSSKDR
jgi:PST family polysaccharide transporter